MSAAAPASSAEKPAPAADVSAPAVPARLPLVSLGVVVLFWTVTFIVRALEIPFFFRFLFGMAAPFLLFLFFNGWWWSRRRISLLDRVIGYALVVGGAFVAGPLAHPSLGVVTALMGWLPIMMSVWILWSFLAQRLQVSRPRIPSILIAGVVWGSMLLLRNEGMDGDLRPDYHWRWSKTAEEQFLASHSSGNAKQRELAAESKTPFANAKMQAVDGDWTGFRGPNRDAKVHGTSIDTDWKQNPPKLLWKHRIGPAWSSMCVIGDRLFTQEQRGEQEAVVCYNAATGEEIWIHEDTARFYEAVSAAGPRATPTFDDGRIYTLGATGILNCLDAASGNVVWRHDLKVESHAEVPQWGMSTSPLVTDGLVIVFGGGENRPNLLAFDAESGKPHWAADAGATTYASPHAATLGGKRQVLILSDAGLISVDPAGKRLWQGGAAMPGAPRNLQPNIVDETHLVQGTFDMGTTTLVAVSQKGEAWEAAADWSSPGMKPEFSDLIVHNGHAYGFDGAIFCCVELETGKRTWKGGRYGRGQALLLADQDLLLVLSEKGEAILVAANPDQHQELARIQAITGKTWNHPALIRNLLYVRNAEEIACYELAQQK